MEDFAQEGFGSSEATRKKVERLMNHPNARVVQIDDEICVAVGPNSVRELDAKVVRALRAGKTISRKPGTQEWIETDVLCDFDKQGSDQFQWHSDGERVRCERFHCTLADGEKTRESLGFVWRKF